MYMHKLMLGITSKALSVQYRTRNWLYCMCLRFTHMQTCNNNCTCTIINIKQTIIMMKLFDVKKTHDTYMSVHVQYMELIYVIITYN